MENVTAHTPTGLAIDPSDGLFASVQQGSARELRPRQQKLGALMTATGVLQASVLATAYLLPIASPQLPSPPDLLGILVYDPPPPPPVPLPKGSALRAPAAAERPMPVVEEPSRLDLAVPLEVPQPTEAPMAVPERGVRPEDQFGSENGSNVGTALGSPEGVDGGEVGGEPGGKPGGVVGADGDGPVPDFDAPPRIIRQPKPRYPQEAFAKKVEGTVMLLIRIDALGRVVEARVIESIPALDEAAREAVLLWQFQPALKHGRPVVSVARAPVRFVLY